MVEMSKYYGAACAGPGCVDNPLFWCERQGDYCNGGGMGGRQVVAKWAELSRSEFQKWAASDPNLFLLSSKFEVLRVGELAEVGMQVGDSLVGVYDGDKFLDVNDLEDFKHMLSFTYSNTLVYFKFSRQEKEYTRSMVV
jgi:hypothetical protein